MENQGLAKVFQIPVKLLFLEAICWQIAEVKSLAPEEMLRRYELGWHYWGVLGKPSLEELSFIKALSQFYQFWLVAELGSRHEPATAEFCEISPPIFKRELHQKILTVLSHLNVEFLRECRAYFGGGTLCSLQNGEYRLSKDIDFMCPMDDGYRQLRRQVASGGYNAIFSRRDRVALFNEIQANQYGIRFPVIVDGTTIKFEMICEARIQLGEPEYPSLSLVPCLNLTDRFAEKLLVNADIWPINSVNSRDLIDIAVKRLVSPIPQEAIAKAESAYPVIEPLKRAIQHFQNNSEYRDKCYNILSVAVQNKVIDGIDLLANDLGMEATVRTFNERREIGNEGSIGVKPT